MRDPHSLLRPRHRLGNGVGAGHLDRDYCGFPTTIPALERSKGKQDEPIERLPQHASFPGDNSLDHHFVSCNTDLSAYPTFRHVEQLVRHVVADNGSGTALTQVRFRKWAAGRKGVVLHDLVWRCDTKDEHGTDGAIPILDIADRRRPS